LRQFDFYGTFSLDNRVSFEFNVSSDPELVFHLPLKFLGHLALYLALTVDLVLHFFDGGLLPSHHLALFLVAARLHLGLLDEHALAHLVDPLLFVNAQLFDDTALVLT
jgi:hypothetical protein